MLFSYMCDNTKFTNTPARILRLTVDTVRSSSAEAVDFRLDVNSKQYDLDYVDERRVYHAQQVYREFERISEDAVQTRFYVEH